MLKTAIAPAGDNSMAAFDVERLREDFPILSRTVNGKPLVYLDNGASAQKPRQVIEAMTACYEGYYSNVHRGVHTLSQESTEAFEQGREKVASFINAASSDEVVFTRGTTEAINLVAGTFGPAFMREGDEVILSVMEHHSNIIPWQLLRDRLGIVIKVVPIDDAGNFDLEAYKGLLSERTKLVALTHISNALGTIVPVEEVIRLAHSVGAKVLLDGAQAAPHAGIDMQALSVDFYAFSGHKLYGPTGIGVLYGRQEILAELPPYQGGGEMISRVTFEKSTYKAPPHRFEAGTPAIAEVIGLGAAVDYVSAVGVEAIQAHEDGLLAYATELLSDIEGLTIHGQAREKVSILSFTMAGCHAHDIGTVLDQSGIAVRAGHHCAQPLMDRLGVPATARAAFGLYNTRAEVDALAAACHKVKDFFG